MIFVMQKINLKTRVSGYGSVEKFCHYVENIISKASKRMYILYQVKRSRSERKDLLKIYLSVIRPVLEYTCPVWHPHLPKYLSDSIEHIQQRALRYIYNGRSYEDILSDLYSIHTHVTGQKGLAVKKIF